MTPSRRAHRKTRTGCSQCKRRKIKCDESRPSCKNCVRHSYDCDFAHLPQPPPGASDRPNSLTPSQFSNPRNNASPGNLLAGNSPPPPAQAFTLNMVDLELLHNFSTTTCLTLSNDQAIRTLWKISVPQIGFTHEFVMRGILAMSALHMAQFNPDKADFYYAQSLSHQQVGLQLVSQILPNVTNENCAAMYIFSAMIAMCALGAPTRPGDLLINDNDDNGIGEWLQLFRGVRSVIENSYDYLLSGTLGPMFQAGARRFMLMEIEPIDDSILQELRRCIERTVPDPNLRQIYIDAVDLLQSTIAFVYSGPPESHEPADFLVWLYRVSEEYLALLKSRTQVALTIFGFSCVLLKRLDGQWWVRGKSMHFIARVYRLLDEEHRLWVRWPIEEIGWIPNTNGVTP